MNKRFAIVSVVCLFLFSVMGYAAFDSMVTPKVKDLEITRITPEGEDVPSGRQIVIQFNRSVVPLGRMERRDDEIPVSIRPKLEGKWCWLNNSALAYQLDEKNALKLSTVYRVVVRPGIMTEDGMTLKREYRHQFITKRPGVVDNNFFTWKTPGTPVIRFSFDQPVLKTSVEAHLFFLPKTGNNQKVKIKAEPEPKISGTPYPDSGDEEEGADGPVQPSEEKIMINGIEARSVWLIKPVKELPRDTHIDLKLEPGLVSAYGPERGIEKTVVVNFDTFPAFRFLGVKCQTLSNDGMVMISADKFVDMKSIKANPMGNVFLVFSSPVLPDEIKKSLVFRPSLGGGVKGYDPWANEYPYSSLQMPHKKGNEYTVRIPELLKANRTYYLKEKKPGIRDEFGRKLPKPLLFTFMTDHRKPNLTLANHYGVLEDGLDTDVPLYVTNLKTIKINARGITPEGDVKNISVDKPIPKVMDVAFAIPMGIRELLNGKSGAIFGSIESDPLVLRERNDNTFFTQVTPFQVQAKLGHFNTLVWVTDLAKGQAVEGAEVTVYKGRINALESNPPVIAQSVTGKDGAAWLPGNESLDPELQMDRWGWQNDGLFVKIRKNDKMALLPLSPEFEVDTWRISDSVGSSQSRQYGHMTAWGTTAQGIYKAGDTIQYKIYVRNQSNEKFVLPPLKSYTLSVIDPMGKTVFEQKNLQLSEFGALSGEYTVPVKGAVGWYRFQLTSDFTKETWSPVSVLVSDFTPSPFRVTTELSGNLFREGDAVGISTHARLHSGGPYTAASTRVTARLEEQPFTSDDPNAKDFYFSTTAQFEKSRYVFEKVKNLNDKGDLSERFVVKGGDILFGKLKIESAVQDDRGKYVASAASADYSGRTRFAGLKSEKWLYQQGESARFTFIVVDEKGKPVKGVNVKLSAEHQVVKAAKVKGAGNAYLTNYITDWEKETRVEKMSGDSGESYAFTPKNAGTYRISAEVTDTKGKTQRTEMRTWVVGTGRVLWEEPDNNSLEIIPQDKVLKVGDTARFLVKNPFPGATALISVERYGVLKHWTQKLDTSTPVIEVPVLPDYIPGFYFSVTVMSPRVEKPLGKGNVDLGKPAFRTGYVSCQVKDSYKEIKVAVKPEKPVYKPGSRVKVSLQTVMNHADNTEPVEIAVAVLDEAVFDLLKDGKDHFNPYNGFYHTGPLDLINYSLLTQIIGRQKFEKKGASPGGDGGSKLNMRSVFKYVSYWNPSIKPDKDGKADIEFTVPDNLTGWRVFAMAVTPSDHMGLGDASFKINADTEIRPAMPNQVLDGDSFKAGFTVMNRTDKPRSIDVTIQVKGPVENGDKAPGLSKKIECAPYKRVEVWLPVKTKGTGDLIFTVSAKDSKDGDGLIAKVPVLKRLNYETAANYGSFTQDSTLESFLVPELIDPDSGFVSVVLSPSVIGNADGAFMYMKSYPYSCWEQKLSKAVMAAHYLAMTPYLSDTVSWPDAGTCITESLKDASNFQTPSGAMAFFTTDDRHASPYLSAYTALAFNWLKARGYTVPDQVEKKLLDYIGTLFHKDMVPEYYSAGMLAGVRAVALCALAEQGRISLPELKRFEPHVARMDLFGKAMYMHAALNVNGADKQVENVCRMILAASNQTGGKFMFSETKDDGYAWMLSTSIRDNAAILSAFSLYSQRAEGNKLVGDIPFKLVRWITQARGSRDHWENTQENIFCMNALINYASVYEKDRPAMNVSALFSRTLLGKTEFKDVKDPAVTFKTPLKPDDAGKKTSMTITRIGTGRLYYASGITYEPKDEKAEPVNKGIEIRKELSVERKGAWVLLKKPMQIHKGDIVRVDLFLTIPGPRNFVVVDDHVPGGLEPVNRDLATASTVDADKGKFKAAGGSIWYSLSNWHEYNMEFWSFYHRELRNDSVRFYSDYLEAGYYHLSCVTQAICEGEFKMMPVQAEEMYDPDVYGKGLPGVLIVGNKK